MITEREAYIAGDLPLAEALGRIDDLQRALGESLARELDHEETIAHLKRILVDALVDDSWRERAAAAVAE